MNEKTIELSPLPDPAAYIDQSGECLPQLQGDVFTADQMHAYLLTDRASRSRAASEPGEVARLAEQLKRSLTFTDPHTGIWYHERIDRLASMASSPASEAQAGLPLTDDDVQWVVNDNAELGVKIGEQFFFLYKGYSLVYERGLHDDDTPMHWRPVFKREFGECCHPINYANLKLIGTVSLDDSDEWKPLPPALASAPMPASSPVAAEGQKAVEWQTPPASWRLLAKAAINLLLAVDEKHDTKQPPAKYSIPYGAVHDLRRALGAATPTASMADAAEAAKCACGDRLASECDEQWGPNCDLGNNAAHVRVSTVDPAVIDAALAAPGPRGENAGGVVEALSREQLEPLWRKHCHAIGVIAVQDFNFACAVMNACATAWGLRIAEKGDAS